MRDNLNECSKSYSNDLQQVGYSWKHLIEKKGWDFQVDLYIHQSSFVLFESYFVTFHHIFLSMFLLISFDAKFFPWLSSASDMAVEQH